MIAATIQPAAGAYGQPTRDADHHRRCDTDHGGGGTRTDTGPIGPNAGNPHVAS